MPITKSAKKALRSSLRKKAHNLRLKEAYKEALRGLRQNQNPKQKKALLPKVYSAIDKAAKKGVIHPNKAARLKTKAAAR